MDIFHPLTIVIISAGLGIFILFLIGKRKKKISAGEEGFVRTQWRIVSLGRNPKNDVLEADKLLDYVLGKYGYQGSLGEKLKKASKLFSDLNGVWEAHKLRNKLAHEINFIPNQKVVSEALTSFRKALIDLKIKL